MKNSTIFKCKFSGNSGKGSVKLYNDFDENENGAIQLEENSIQSAVAISQCRFEIDLTSSCSLFYAQGTNRAVDIDLTNCIFTGELKNGSFHIDGSLSNNEKNSSKLRMQIFIKS